MLYAKILEINRKRRQAIAQVILDPDFHGSRFYLRVNNANRRASGKPELRVGDVVDIDEQGRWRHVREGNRAFADAVSRYREHELDEIADLMMPNHVMPRHQRRAGEVLVPAAAREAWDTEYRRIVPRKQQPWDEESRREDDEFSMWNFLGVPA